MSAAKRIAKRRTQKKTARRKVGPRGKAARRRAAPRKPTRRKAAPVRRREAAAPPAAPSAPPEWLAPRHAAVDDLTSSGDELLDIFQRYDRDRNGAINRIEFARLLEGLGQELNDIELQVALDAVDAHGTGEISYADFRAWWAAR